MSSSPSHTRSSLDIAVIIVTYKCAALTIESLASIALERTKPGLDIRVIVVDNDSGDLPDIGRAVDSAGWSDWITLVQAPRNGGFAYGNNLGISRAYRSGRPAYIYLLNPDAQVKAGAIHSLAHFLETHSRAGIAGSTFEGADGTKDPIAFRFPNIYSEIIQGVEFKLVTRLLQRWFTVRYMAERDEPVDWICGASMMIRPEVFDVIGGLDENYFLYFEETDFCRRAKDAGFETWFVSSSRVMHIGGQSTTVTDRRAGLKRLPSYWYESRRRYFAVTYGSSHAKTIDIVAVLANLIGIAKHFLQGRLRRRVPYYVRDLMHHSIVWTRNQAMDGVRSGLMLRN